MATRQARQTADGLAKVVEAVLRVYGNEECLDSECKQALNHLIRAYGDQFLHRTPNHVSTKVRNAPVGTTLIKDHVVPVRNLMEYLMRASKRRTIDSKFIQNFLDKYSITCLITKDEDAALRRAKLWHCMPVEAVCKDTGEVNDPWARYSQVKIRISSKPMRVGLTMQRLAEPPKEKLVIEQIAPQPR